MFPLPDIALYHAMAENSLRLYHSTSNPAYATAFANMTQSEINFQLGRFVEETEVLSILIIIARLEAAFRLDMRHRFFSKNPDNLSTALRRLYKRKPRSAKLDNDIFPIWRDHLDGPGRQVLSKFKGMLKYRHWIAHGRYWHFSPNHSYTDAYILATTILTQFDLKT